MHDKTTDNQERVCRTCRLRLIDPYDGGWRCVCGDSEYCTEWVNDDDTCEFWEGRKE